MNRYTEREFRNAMGQFCTGVVVITGIAQGQPLGFSAQSFVSLSLDPPLVAISPARSSTTWPLLRQTGRFGINMLAADQGAICARFARSGGDKFEGLSWTLGSEGSPLLDGVIGAIECEVQTEHEAGDHTLVIARVLDLQQCSDAPPLLFFRGTYGSFEGLSRHNETS